MSSALHAFMERLVDYAGLFPPATLDMETAVAQYADYRARPEAWMLGRFIVPAGRLNELATAAENYLSSPETWGVSVLLGHREDPAQAFSRLKEQCRAITGFEGEPAVRGAIEMLEVPIPAQVKSTDVADFLNRYLDGLDEFCIRGRELFWEIPPGASEETDFLVLKALAAVAASRSGAGQTVLRLGAKLRCGGVVAEAFPSVDRVSRVVAHCRDLGLALKCTAGLHHPVRYLATQPAAMMHGFLNVFGAGLLAHAHGWDAEKLAQVVSETQPEAFVFDADKFSWRGHTVPADVLRSLRVRFLSGFGSCSFDEPRDDLRDLGLL